MQWAPDLLIAGGFFCGALAGGAVRYGRLCSMSAIEDALVGKDWRAAKAWGVALATAIAATQAFVLLGVADLTGALYPAPAWHALGTMLGGLLFGLGMALAGTCSFGLLVRAGAGDLRSAVSAMVVGITAFAVTAGVLAPARELLLSIGTVQMGRFGGSTLTAITDRSFGQTAGIALWISIAVVLPVLALLDRRLRNRPRLLAGAGMLGLAIAAGWCVTSSAVERLLVDRPESLSFVAPVGRALLQLMMQPFRNLGFGVSTIAGVIAASFAVAAWRRELRWEAFDDPTEMRRHLFGASLMGAGGVLAQGCTIGQGLSAASTLAVSAPVFVAAILLGARLGLYHLIDGRSLWRLGTGRPAS